MFHRASAAVRRHVPRQLFQRVRGGGPTGSAARIRVMAIGAVTLLLLMLIMITATRRSLHSSSTRGEDLEKFNARRSSNADGVAQATTKKKKNGGKARGFFDDDPQQLHPRYGVDAEMEGEEQQRLLAEEQRLVAAGPNSAEDAKEKRAYCSPDSYKSLGSMHELAHRSLEIPLDEAAPALVRPVLSDGGEGLHGQFERSLEQLSREKTRTWQYTLEGTRVTSNPVENLLSLPNPFHDLHAGFYCLSVWDDVDSCVISSVPFVVIDEHRKDSEYAVTPTTVISRTIPYRQIVERRGVADSSGSVKVFKHRDISLMFHKYVPLHSVAPVVMSVPSVVEQFWSEAAFMPVASAPPGQSVDDSAFSPNSTLVQARHVRIGSGDNALDLEYGKGSLWVMTGRTYQRARVTLARREFKFLEQSAAHPKDAVSRASFEHYSGSRLVLATHVPDEDEWFEEEAAAAVETAKGNSGDNNDTKHHHHASTGRRTFGMTPPNSNMRLGSSTGRHNNRRLGVVNSSSNDVHRSLGSSGGQRRAASTANGPVRRQRRPQPHRGENKLDEKTLTPFTAYVEALGGRQIDLVSVPPHHFKSPRDAADLISIIRDMKGDDICLIRLAWSITIETSLELRRPCLVVVDEKVTVTVRGRGGRFAAHGSSNTDTILFTTSDVASTWGGFIVEAEAVLSLRFAMVTRVGSLGVPRVKGTGTHIKHYAPVFTAVPGHSRIVVEDSAILNCEGSVFALGAGSTTVITRTLIQDVAQGGECVSCTVNISKSHLLDFPYRTHGGGGGVVPTNERFVDGDNDGFYFRGGHASVEDTVIANALDDCIDSASSTGDNDHSSLTLRHVAIENCQHEGIALSGSKGTKRTVRIENSLITACQQGIENGHTPIQHRTTIEHTVFFDNHIAVRNGDNYPTLDVFGKVDILSSVLSHNTMPVLDWVMIDHMRKTKRNTYFDAKMFQYECHNPLLAEGSGGASSAVMEPLITIKDSCILQSPAASEADESDSPAELAATALTLGGGAHDAYRERRTMWRHSSGLASHAGGVLQDENGKVRENAEKKHLSSAELSKGIFCGHKHFNVQGQFVADT